MTTAAIMHASPLLDAKAFDEVRRRTIFECCKWDPQVEDVSVLAPYAIVLDDAAWRGLADQAERLEQETLAAEREALCKPALLRRLGLTRTFLRSLRQPNAGMQDWPRVTRYDFHLTTDGWRISEANTDVPGGYIEASGFTRLMCEALGDDVAMTGDPADAIGRAIRDRTFSGARIGLVHATAFTDDRQVMIYLQSRLAEHDLRCELLAPDHVQWTNGCASAGDEPLDAILRFYPAEWLPRLPRRSGWRHFVSASHTPLVNPATALVTQSKRFPLVWNDLTTDVSTWRALLPHTCDPRTVDYRDRSKWVLKPALGRVGDCIGIEGATTHKDWQRIARSVRWFPSHWIAQRRFDALPLDTPDGQRYAALGVYVIEGKAAGIYGRISPKPLINHLAQDVAVLVRRSPLNGQVAANHGVLLRSQPSILAEGEPTHAIA